MRLVSLRIGMENMKLEGKQNNMKNVSSQAPKELMQDEGRDEGDNTCLEV
jgi:hypothetical protein